MFRDYNKYDVQPDGRIWSKVRKKWLKPTTTKDGYQRVGLVDNNGKLHMQCVHKIVYFAVNGLWEYPDGYELNHKDENKCNNNIDNLELVTHKQNINFGTRNARTAKKQSKRVGAFKDGELIMVFPSTMEAERNGFNHSAVAACCRGKLPHYKSFVWRYINDNE